MMVNQQEPTEAWTWKNVVEYNVWRTVSMVQKKEKQETFLKKRTKRVEVREKKKPLKIKTKFYKNTTKNRFLAQ